jgi:hypothetical protein
MTTLTTRGLACAATGAVALVLSGCASSAAEQSPTPTLAPTPGAAAAQELTTRTTVLSRDGSAAPVLCLDVVLESYPPICDGPAVLGWDWSGLEGAETAAGTTWGRYEVTGTWDGTAFTVTSPARPWDGVAVDLLTPGSAETAGTAASPAVTAAVEDYRAAIGTDDGTVLGVEELDGRARVHVIVDDGTLQRSADERYGPGVVVIDPALEPAADPAS